MHAILISSYSLIPPCGMAYLITCKKSYLLVSVYLIKMITSLSNQIENNNGSEVIRYNPSIPVILCTIGTFSWSNLNNFEKIHIWKDSQRFNGPWHPVAFTFYDSASQYAISTLCGTVYIAKTRDLSLWHSEYIFGILTSRSWVQTSWLAMGLLSTTLLLYNSCRGEEWIVNPRQGLFFS